MGFFTNTGALNEGEIVLSSDHRHLYKIIKGKFVEFQKRYTSVIPNFWKPGQEPGESVYDSTKKIIYKYNTEDDLWIEFYNGMSFNHTQASNVFR